MIDFKSNDRTQQEEVTDLQLRVYALGYEQATGERASEVVVDNLDDLDHPRRSLVDETMLSRGASRRCVETGAPCAEPLPKTTPRHRRGRAPRTPADVATSSGSAAGPHREVERRRWRERRGFSWGGMSADQLQRADQISGNTEQ